MTVTLKLVDAGNILLEERTEKTESNANFLNNVWHYFVFGMQARVSIVTYRIR